MQYLLIPTLFQFLIGLQGQRREDIKTDEGVNLEVEYENLNCNLQCQENEYQLPVSPCDVPHNQPL